MVREEEWEIPLEKLVMIKQLGKGNFGEVQLAYISPDIKKERAKSYMEKTKYRNPCIPPNLVAVKRLKGNIHLNWQNIFYYYILIILGYTTIDEQISFIDEMNVTKKASDGECPHVVNIYNRLYDYFYSILHCNGICPLWRSEIFSKEDER